MKRTLLSLAVMIGLILSLCFVLGGTAALAEVSGTCGTVMWVIHDDGRMVFSPTDGAEGTLAVVPENNAPWQSSISQIKSISFSGKVYANANSSYLFAYMHNVETIDCTNLDTSNSTSMEGMFGECYALKNLNVSGLDVSKVKNFYALFYHCTSLESVDLSAWNTSSATSMRGMFYYCEGLKSLDLSHFNTSKVTTMQYMFYYCTSLETLDIPFNTGSVTGSGMTNMFENCYSLKVLDLSSFNFAKITNIRNLCSHNYEMESVTWPASSDFSKTTNMSYMFSYCRKLKSMDMSGFITTTKLTSAETMFGECKGLETLDISGLNLTNVAYFSDFLHGCESLSTLKLGSSTYSAENLSNGFLRGIWKYDKDGKNYLSTEISDKLHQGPMAGTLTRVAEAALTIPYALDYQVNRYSQGIDKFVTTNSAIKRSGSLIYMQVDGSKADSDGTLKVDGSFSIYLNNMVKDAQGNPYKLKITYSNIILYDAAEIKYSSSAYTKYYHEFFNVTEKGIVTIIGEDRRRLDEEGDPSVSTNAVYDITMQILDQNDKVMKGSFLFSVYDLDIPCPKDMNEPIHQNSVERASNKWAYGLYSEGVYLKDGFDLDSIIVADNTYLNLMGTGDGYEGYRVHGSQIDSASERTDLIIKASAQGSTFTWTGFSCVNYLFYLYQPKPVHLEKLNESGKYLNGASMELYRINGKGGREKVVSWTSGAEPYNLFLPSGKYVLHEAKAPKGYEKGADVTFLVDTDFDICDESGNKLDNGNRVWITDRCFYFRFTKKWTGAPLSGIEWTFYNADGTEAHGLFNKTVISNTEWYYERKMDQADNYYIIEKVPEGYMVKYENVGLYAGVTDRCYTGGTILNIRIPVTGDASDPLLWIGVTVLSVSVLCGILLINRRRARKSTK